MAHARPALLAALVWSAAASPAAAFWLGARGKSAWAAAPITVDGKADDWTLSPEDETEGVAYGFANDDRYLYLVLVPHTRQAKEQLAGVFQQDLMLWLDRGAGKNKTTGVLVLAPASLDQPARALDLVRLSTAAGEAVVAASPLQSRAALEARLPLAYLGSPLPEQFTVGIETQYPRHPPAQPAPERSRDAHEAPPAAKFETLQFWVRVTLARPPATPLTK
jgi:hypothetical protein